MFEFSRNISTCKGKRNSISPVLNTPFHPLCCISISCNKTLNINTHKCKNCLVMWRHSCYVIWKPDILKMCSWHYNYVLGFEFKWYVVKDQGGGYIYLLFRSSNIYQTPNLVLLTSGEFIAKNGLWYIFDRVNKKAISRIAAVTLSYEQSEAAGQF